MVGGCLVALIAGCGGDEVAEGPPVLTGQVLGDSLAVALKEELERRGVFGTAVGDRGGMCRGGGARWSCTVDVVIDDHIRDRRGYDLRVASGGCWRARQTGTDVGVTGRPNRPSSPGILRGCVG